MPDRKKIQDHRSLGIFQHILQDPDIFHLTRRSAAGGIATGLFLAFLPLPGHTLLAVVFSIWLRVNLPLCILFAWTTNPVTMAPIYYLAYKTGAKLLGKPLYEIQFEMTWDWLGGRFMDIWPSLLTGCLLFSIASAVIAYVLVRLLWRLAVIIKWKKRPAQKYLR